MKQILYLLLALFLPMSVAACGDDDKDDNDVVTLPAPTVVSTTPANGTTDVETGEVTVSVTYDQAVSIVRSKLYLIGITGGTLSTPTVGDKTLTMTATCPSYGTTVTITLPEGLVANAQGSAAPALTLTFTTKEAPKPDPTPDDGHETAAQAVASMTPGWCLGNSLDSYGAWIGNNQQPEKYETAWGQPVTDAHLMKAFKEKGFKGIRVPVTWYQHIDAEGRVDEAWMNRVEQVVHYVLDQGMYCILNVHHDTGAHDDSWIRADKTYYDNNRERYVNLWRQIAERFKDCDEYLLFEGYNEMLDNANTWNQPRNLSDLQYTNSFAQSFVDAVRATGGNNRYRNLVVNTYASAHSSSVMSGLAMPTDPCGNQSHLAVEVHSYDPWDWVNVYNMTWTAACTTTLQQMFAELSSTFIAKGYPVIIGEYGTNGANEKTINASSTDAQKREAGRQAGDMNRLCRQHGAASFYWMGLVDGKDRSEATFQWTMEQVADSIVAAYK